MTLILTYGNPDHAVQVSDRRLTFGARRYDGTANKAIYLRSADGAFVLAYTGLGRVGAAGQATDLWAVGELTEAPSESIVTITDCLMKRGARIIDDTPGPLTENDLTFVGTGTNNGKLLFFTVSSVLDGSGHHLATVDSHFHRQVSSGTEFVAAFGQEHAASASGVTGQLHAQAGSGLLREGHVWTPNGVPVC